jgi:hypothetical protein
LSPIFTTPNSSFEAVGTLNSAVDPTYVTLVSPPILSAKAPIVVFRELKSISFAPKYNLLLENVTSTHYGTALFPLACKIYPAVPPPVGA